MDNDKNVMHSFKSNGPGSLFSLKFLLVLVVLIGLGVGTGYVLGKAMPGIIPSNALPSPNDKNAIEKGKIYGSADTKVFKDNAEGKLVEGGVEGEGQFHLERTGGESQNVYMTSSSVDLSLFINRKVKVWGETQTAQTAGWLMDVGRVEVLE